MCNCKALGPCLGVEVQTTMTPFHTHGRETAALFFLFFFLSLFLCLFYFLVSFFVVMTLPLPDCAAPSPPITPSPHQPPPPAPLGTVIQCRVIYGGLLDTTDNTEMILITPAHTLKAQFGPSSFQVNGFEICTFVCFCPSLRCPF